MEVSQKQLIRMVVLASKLDVLSFLLITRAFWMSLSYFCTNKNINKTFESIPHGSLTSINKVILCSKDNRQKLVSVW